VLLEKLTGFRLVKKFPAFYETRRITNVKHLKIGKGQPPFIAGLNPKICAQRKVIGSLIRVTTDMDGI